jgi:AraC-like DNA-binding protein
VRRKLAIGAVILAACAFAGGAYAASATSGSGTRHAFLDDAAKRLGVSPQRLKDALAGALQDQLNAAVKAGRLTQAQANAIERHFKQSGGLPLPLGPKGGLHAFRGGPVGAAAHYLGVSVPQLLDQLRGGKSLAQVASSRGKSTSGLENAIVSDERTRLDKARAAGRITATQEQQLLSRLHARVKDLVNGSGLHRLGRREGPGPGGPPPLGGKALPAPGPGGFGAGAPPPPTSLS